LIHLLIIVLLIHQKKKKDFTPFQRDYERNK
jgi:hypothetical protein